MPETTETKTPQQLREDEAARIRQSEEAGQKSGAYNPAFMPGFRPDVYVPEGDTHKQTIGDEEVEVAVRAGDTAVITNPDHHMAPTAGVSGGAQQGLGAGTGNSSSAGGNTAGSGGSTGSTGAGTTGTTATGGAIETGQGSTTTSRAGGSSGAGSGA